MRCAAIGVLLGAFFMSGAQAAAPYDIRESTIPKAGAPLASPVQRGSGSTGSRPALTPNDHGFYDDTTLGERLFWDGRSGKWRNRDGFER